MMQGLTELGVGFSWLAMHFHMMFMLSLLLGLILFMVWAIRDLKAKKLVKLFIWMLAVGVIGSIITAYFLPWGNFEFMEKFRNEQGQEGMMNGVNWSFNY